MRCLRLVGSLKLQVSFAEYSLFNRVLLQKRPIILRSLLIVAKPPHMCIYTYGVATMSRLLKIIGLICKKVLEERLYSGKETYNARYYDNI